MLAAESRRRVPAIQQSLKKLSRASSPDSDAVEEMRVEVHGLKGAALVIGQHRLGQLADRAEQLLAANAAEGGIDLELAAQLTDVLDAFKAGADAAAAGEPEPPSVAEALVAVP